MTEREWATQNFVMGYMQYNNQAHMILLQHRSRDLAVKFLCRCESVHMLVGMKNDQQQLIRYGWKLPSFEE